MGAGECGQKKIEQDEGITKCSCAERNCIPEDISEIYVVSSNPGGKVRVTGNLKNGWIRMPKIGSIYHRYRDSQQGEEAGYNVKFVKPDIYGGACEAVICFPPGRTPYLVEDARNCGTYNIVSPYRYRRDAIKLSVKGLIGHFKKDVIPYLKEKRAEKSSRE